jgi:hypothetical protein
MSGGKNNAFPRHALEENQCADTLNAIHEKIGLSRAPGYCGITKDVKTQINLSFDLFQYHSDYPTEDKTTILGLCSAYISSHSVDATIVWRDLAEYIYANFSTFYDTNTFSLTLKKDGIPIDGQTWSGDDRPPETMMWAITSNETALFDTDNTTITYGTT